MRDGRTLGRLSRLEFENVNIVDTHQLILGLVEPCKRQLFFAHEPVVFLHAGQPTFELRMVEIRLVGIEELDTTERPIVADPLPFGCFIASVSR